MPEDTRYKEVVEELRKARERLEEYERAERALRESEQQCRELVMHAPSAIYEIDFRERRFRSVNDAMCRMLGYSREELLALDPFVLLDEAGRSLLQERISRWLRGERPDEFVEFRVRRRDGGVIVAELKAAFTVDEEGKPLGATVIAHDITDRRRLEDALRESEENFRELSDGAPVAIVVYRGNTHLYVNAAAVDMTGYSRDELFTMNVLDIFHPDYREMIQRRAASRAEGNAERARYDVKMITKAGEERWMEVSSGLIRYQGLPAGLVAAVDVTERKRTEAALRESEERFAAAFRSSPDAVAITRLHDGTITEVNEEFEELFGWGREEVIGKTTLELGTYLSPEDRAEGIELLKREGRIRDYEGRARRKNGEVRDVSLSAEIIRIGEEPMILSVTRDVTERRRAEEALRESEENFRELSEASPAVVVVYRGSRIIYLNASALGSFGYSREELLTMDFLNLMHPDYREMIRARTASRMAGSTERARYELRIITKSGEARWLDVSSSLIRYGGLPAGLIVSVDITERKRTEEELRKRESTLVQAGQMANLGAWDIEIQNQEDINANPLTWSAQTYRIMGFEPGSVEVSNALFFERVHPDDRQAIVEAVARAIAERRPYTIEHRIIRPDGEVRLVDEHSEIMFDEDGRPRRIVGAIQDITERKRAEEAVRESEARLRAMFENAAVGIAVVSLDNRYLQVNERFCQITGYSRKELVGKRYHEITHADDIPANEAQTENLLVNRSDRIRLQKRYIRKTGETVWVELTSSLVRTHEGEPSYYLGVIEDISERKAAEEELAKANRGLSEANEELSRFGAYVSHDLRAPLRTIRGFGEILQEDYGESLGDDGRDLIDRMIEATKKAAEIISDIQRLTGLDATAFVPEEVDLKEIAEEWYAQQRAREPEKECRLNLVGKLRVRADRRLMTVALTNMFENAVKFAGGQPTVEIELGSQDGGKRVFYVRDNGVGFDGGQAEKLFRPFSRLHDPGKYPGTGLGLAIVRKAIVRHGGQVWAESEAGKGATFYFTVGG